jgi:lipopolysaccharide export system protein LptA
MKNSCLRLLAASLLLCGGFVAHAEKADRSQPVKIDADRVSVDDKNKIHVFEGRVVLSQGSLQISADKLVVTQDLAGFQNGTATGGPDGLARIRQKREGRDDYIEGSAERIVYSSETEEAKLYQRAYIRSGQDEVRGQYILYSGINENYLVTNGPNATVVPSQQGRVHVVIQPKTAASNSGITPNASQGKPGLENR